MITWRKSSYSQSVSECVELANTLTHLRDSKNANGPALRGDLPALIDAIKADRIDRPGIH